MLNLVICLLMFIGASPGSCGGGIKTSTFASLIVLGISRLCGHERPQIFHRTISATSIAKAVSVVMISTAGLVLKWANEDHTLSMRLILHLVSSDSSVIDFLITVRS
jgi:Trk-type K+ transport system membrane component